MVVVGVVVMVGLVGCASPAGVEGLLRTAEGVLAEERQAIEVDAERASQSMEERRAGLEAAFEADVEQREELDEAWVLRGVRAYVDAREALVRHEAELEATYAQRRRNLRLAAEAVERARELLAQQDGLLERVPDVRAYLHEAGGGE